MKKPENQIDILTEAAVFDYVAGHQSAEARANFERMLAKDKSLQEAVASERRLRAKLLEGEKKTAGEELVRSDNISALFERLDQLEKGEDRGETGDESAGQATSLDSRFSKSNWYGVAGLAASAVFATVLVLGQQPDRASPDYSLLSDVPVANEVAYSDLVEANKVAQIWLEGDVPSDEISLLFKQYRLEPISRSGSAWIVSSEVALSTQELSTLKASEHIHQVNLVSFDNPINAQD